MYRPHPRHPRRRRALVVVAAAAALFPPAALAVNYDLTGQTVNLDAAPYSASDNLTLNATTLTSSVVRSLASALTAASASGGTFNTAANLSLTGPISGTGTIHKSGTATLALVGNASGFSGTFDVTGGTLQLRNASALGTGSSPITLTNATLDFSGFTTPRQFAPSNATFVNTWDNTPVTINWQFLSTTAANLNFAGTGAMTVAANYPAITGTLTKSGSSFLTYSTPTAFTGGVVVNAGTLTLGTQAPFAGSSGSLTVNAGGTLDLNGFSSPGTPVTLNGGSLFNGDDAHPVTVGPSLSISPASASFAIGGWGDMTFASPLPAVAGPLTTKGNGTVTYSTPTAVAGGITVSGHSLRLGIASPFAGSAGPLTVGDGASLDLNGFSSPGVPVTLAGGFTGGALVNNNTAVTSTVPTLPSGPLTLGGAGDINLTAKVAPLTKTGTGTLVLSAANPTFSGTLTLSSGTLRLNAAAAAGTSSAVFALNGNSTTSGALDLNGFNAPAGTYNFKGGLVVNDNTATPSTIDFSAAHAAGTKPVTLGGAGDIVATGTIPSGFYKLGPGAGTLTLSPPAPGSVTGTISAGTLRIGNANQAGTFTLNGSASGYPFRPTVVDLNGLASLTLSLTINDNAGIVNNNTSTPVTVPAGVSASFETFGSGFAFGGDGTLNLPPTLAFPSNHALHKIGAGLLTLPATFSPASVNLRAGTLQAEANSQLGSSISFLGGTLRVAPLDLAPQSSYTFTSAISVDPAAGGALDAQRDATFAGPLTGSGPFTKTGTASATLNPAPSSRLALSVQAGTLRLRPALPTAPAVTSLSISPGASVDLADNNLVLDYTGPSPADALRQYLASHQLFSSTADADPRHLTTLACIEASALLRLTGTQTATWSGQTVDATSLLLKYSYYGDANLDGKLNADDYALLDRSFAKHLANPRWTDGDFNYDGAVDQSDYLLIDSTYLKQQGGAPSPAFLAQRESQFGAAYAQSLIVAVPEPSPLLAACGFALPLLPRRRTKS